MQEISEKMKEYKVNFDHPAFKENPAAADLLSKMLQYNENERPTANQALDHEWMTSRLPDEQFSLSDMLGSKQEPLPGMVPKLRGA